MKTVDLQIGRQKYAFYSWVSYDNQSFENGKSRFLDENTLIKDIRKTDKGYNVLVEFSNDFNKWVLLDDNCCGETYMSNNEIHKYEIKEL
jgi:hypothetical protein